MPTSSPHNAEAPSRFREVQHTPLMRALIRAFVLSTGFLPVWFMQAVAVLFVLPVAVPLTLKNFRGMMRNMRRMEPQGSRLKTVFRAWSVYKNYAYYLIDLLYLSHSPERLREYTLTKIGPENLGKALDLGKGVILLTTHLGNWEIGGKAFGERGKKIHMVYAPDSSDLFERQRNLMRGQKGVQSLALKPGEMAALELYRLLKCGECIAMQGDRLQFDRGVSVPFFGAPATFPQGMVRIAQLSGSPIVPIFIPRKGYKAYDVIIEAPLRMDPKQSLADNLTHIVSVFERHIGRYKTQWYTFIPFWDEDRERPSP